MTARRHIAAIFVGVALLLPAAAPVAADHIGGALTLCGQVLDYTAATAVADGSLSINGVSDPDPHPFVIQAAASVTLADSALLTTIAAGDNFTCLSATGDGMPELTAVAIASSTTLCGPVSRSASLDFVLTDEGFEGQRSTLTAEAAALVAANPGLDELFGAFADFGEQRACVAFTTGADGVVDSLLLGGIAQFCGQLEDASAHPRTFIFELGGGTWTPAATITLGGITIPSSTFSPTVLAALEFTSSSQASAPTDACFVLDIGASEIVPNMSRVTSIDTTFCGDATETEGDGLWLDAVNITGSPSRVLLLPELHGGGNLEQAIRLAMGGITPDFQPVGGCLSVMYEHNGVAERLSVFLSGTVTFEVVSRSGTQVVVRRVSDSAEFSFAIGAESDVPACMQAGYRSAGTVATDLAGQISFTPLAACAGPDGAGGVPDTSAADRPASRPPLLIGLAILGLGAALGGRRVSRFIAADA